MIFQIERGQEPLRGQEKGRGNQLESGSCGLFQRTGGGDETPLPEADRSVSSRLREKAEEADDKVGGVEATRPVPATPICPSKQ